MKNELDEFWNKEYALRGQPKALPNHQDKLKILSIRLRGDLASSNTHANSDECFQRSTAIDQKIFIPFYNSFLKKQDNCRATW